MRRADASAAHVKYISEERNMPKLKMIPRVMFRGEVVVAEVAHSGSLSVMRRATMPLEAHVGPRMLNGWSSWRPLLMGTTGSPRRAG